MRSYLPWPLLALLGYSIFTPLAQVATERVPSTVVALVATAILASSALAVVLFNGGIRSRLSRPTRSRTCSARGSSPAGASSRTTTLSLAPVSVGTPVYGVFRVGRSVLGFLFLGDELTARKAAGIALAVVAVSLTVTG